jgi:hypothetical protein
MGGRDRGEILGFAPPPAVGKLHLCSCTSEEIFSDSGPRIRKCVLASSDLPSSHPPCENLGGTRHELSARQQPEALVRLGLGTPQEFLQAGCGAAATNVNVSSALGGARVGGFELAPFAVQQAFMRQKARLVAHVQRLGDV